MADTINCNTFTQLLVDETPPRYAKEIMMAVRPNEGEWIGHMSTGNIEAHGGVTLSQDRFENVQANTTRPWTQVSYASCVGNPCAKVENQIGWGSSRTTFFLEQQSWGTPLVCFNQEMFVTHAVEQWSQIISKILKPATQSIVSMMMRKRALYFAGKKYVAGLNFGSTAGEFAYIWQNDSDGNEVYFLTNQMPTSKLTPQMLQRRVSPLRLNGYNGETPFGEDDSPPLIELVAGLETCWELDRLVGQTAATGNGGPTTVANYRFEQWAAANKYWRYGYTGQIGDYAVRIDERELRFQYIGASGNAIYPYKFQLLLPYVNIVSSGAGGAAGLKSEVNDAYQTSQYRISFVTHKKSLKCLFQDSTSINPSMPFAAQDFAGKWRFVLPNVCVDQNGAVTPIDNRRGNMGQWLGDFAIMIKAEHPEWTEAYFHQAEPSCILNIAPCNIAPTYSAQAYSSANAACP